MWYYIYVIGDFCYACPTNKEQNVIHAAIFQKHIPATHPSITSNEIPPKHTLIIEAIITRSISKKSNQKLTIIFVIELLQVVGMQMLWWALNTSIQRCVYICVHISCVSTTSIWQIKYLEEMKHYVEYLMINWNTMHQVINTKTTTKVWTVNATDVEWIECEHVNKTGLILQLET